MNINPKDGILVWTLTTNGYKYFTLNLYRHWQQAQIPTPLTVVCADKPVFRFFRAEGIPCVLYEKAQPDSTGQLLLFGSKAFQEINAVKLDILHQFARNPAIETCVYLDGDIVVQSNFLPDLLTRLETTPLLFQCDEQKKEACHTPCQNCCTGVIAWRHGHDGGIFQLTDKKVWREAPEDQRWVNRRLQETATPYATLPRDLYPNGVFSAEPPADFHLLHYNWLVGNAKLQRMRKNGHWLIPYM